MKSFSNTYIFVFSTVMVMLVATLLSFVAEQLKPFQEKNIEIEKKLDILHSVGIARDLDDVKDKDIYVEEAYDKNITKSFAINPEGELKADVEAFKINLKAELAKSSEDRNLPVFVYVDEDGKEIHILPLQGKGLWGPIWGYISLEEDLTTIYGAIFAHSKETPGLGAEINTDWYQAQYLGKKIFDDAGEFTSVRVVKGGADPDDPHAVDAISGGTITSVALQEMMEECLGNYETYFKTKSN
ncbi:MAG: NADH:ubiquinone reductase (Na(+)-transporting) subunit C [Bacteroidales bacterium]